MLFSRAFAFEQYGAASRFELGCVRVLVQVQVHNGYLRASGILNFTHQVHQLTCVRSQLAIQVTCTFKTKYTCNTSITRSSPRVDCVHGPNK